MFKKKVSMDYKMKKWYKIFALCYSPLRYKQLPESMKKLRKAKQMSSYLSKTPESKEVRKEHMREYCKNSYIQMKSIKKRIFNLKRSSLLVEK